MLIVCCCCCLQRRSQTASPLQENKTTEDAQDIKTAALALTSLSLSPAVNRHDEGMSFNDCLSVL